MEQEQTLRILMLEDSDDDAELIVNTLRREKIQFQHRRVETRDAFCEAINVFSPDIVLSDNGLPGFNSIDALKICSSRQPSTPFILVTGAISDDLVDSLRQGADDYVLKSNLARLPLAINRVLDKKRRDRRRDRNAWPRSIWRALLKTFVRPSPRFRVNEAVQHISGGALMVVSGFKYYGEDDPHIVCQWYDRDQGATLTQEFSERELKPFNWNNPHDD